MDAKPQPRPAFYKVMFNDFTRRLRLPKRFVQNYGDILPASIKLRTSSGETWNVQLEQIDEETSYFNRGWTKFAVDVRLKLGEFIVFSFDVDKSTLDFWVYDNGFCERKISGSGSQADDSDSDEDDSEKAARPQLKLLLKKHESSRVMVSKAFAEAAGLTWKKYVMLQYPPKQRCWPVKLLHYTNRSQFRLDMSKGWSEFRRNNGLAFGNTYLFEWIRDSNLIVVKLLDRAN